jgi:hypothetical protein
MPTLLDLVEEAFDQVAPDTDFRFRRHCGLGRACYWLDPVANDPQRTLLAGRISSAFEKDM